MTNETLGEPGGHHVEVMKVTPANLHYTKRTRQTLRSIRAWAHRNYEKAHQAMVDAQAESLHSHRDDMERATARKRAAGGEERMVRWGMYVEAIDEVLATQPSDQDPTLFDNMEHQDEQKPQAPEQAGPAGEGGEPVECEYEVTGGAADAGAGGQDGSQQDGAARARTVQDGGGEDDAGPEDREGAQPEGRAGG